ncbi:MAG TPA: hypothetical protein VFW80_11145 [Gaiellaceae bacterium]|nr:hypothetical protein [Gaiellaceae bacterium]
MRLAEQWQEIEGRLPDGWRSARLSVSVAEDADSDRAALILSSLTPGRTGSSFRLEVRPERNPEGIFRRLDGEGIRGRVDPIGSDAGPAETVAAAPPSHGAPLARQWDELAADLPPDWSELYAELELDSSDYVPRAALLLAPVNPARYGGPTVLRFRSASRMGYGTSAEMTRRCLERLDAEQITGDLRALRALSHTSHAATQGPVWRVGGRSV